MSLFSVCMMANGYYGFKIIDVRLLDKGQIAFHCYYFFGITVVRGELTMISFSIVFFFLSLFAYFVLYLSSLQFILSIIVSISPTLSRSLLMQSPSQYIYIYIYIYIYNNNNNNNGNFYSAGIRHVVALVALLHIKTSC